MSLKLGDDFNALTEAVIGAAIEVHRTLGPGLDEALYENALRIELELRGIPFLRQMAIQVPYKGKIIGEKRLDLVIDGRLVVELKTVEQLAKVHQAQVNTYLKITGMQCGLLINFNEEFLKEGLKRILRTL